MKNDKIKNFFKTLKIIYSLMPIWLFIYILLTITLAFYPMFSVLIEKSFFDQIIANINSEWTNQSIQNLIRILILFFSLNLYIYIVYKWQNMLDIFMNGKLKKFLHIHIMKKIDKLDYEVFDDNIFYNKLQLAIKECSTGNILKIHLNFIKLISFIITLISLSLILFNFSYIALIIAIIASIPGFIHQAWYGKKNWEFNSSQIPLIRKMDYFLTLLTTPNYIKENKLYNTKEFYLKKYDSLFAEQNASLKKLNKKNLWVGIVLAIIHTIGTVAVILYAYYAAMKSQISLGEAVLYAAITHSIYNTMQNIIFYYGEFKSSQKGNINILLFLNEKNEKKKESKESISNISTIRFENVYFKYPNSDRFILEDVSFVLEKNKKYALVGENGAGKSTILKLLLRLYSPTKGSIYINDIEISNISNESISQLFNCCFQDYFVYPFSVRENIALSNINDLNNDEKIMIAIKKSGLDSLFIEKEKINELLTKQFSNTGIVLSGGQSQKLALARAFFDDKQVLVLDEPTASLDAVTEHQIFEQILSNIDEKLVLFITHRLSNVVRSDYILLLKNGKIDEINSHIELLKNNDYYKNLFYTQAKEYL